MGLSPRNLWNMKRFYLRYCQYDTKVQQAVAVLPWSHIMLLLIFLWPRKKTPLTLFEFQKQFANVAGD